MKPNHLALSNRTLHVDGLVAAPSSLARVGWSLVLVAGMSACGGVDDSMGGGSGSNPDPDDTTAPTILSTTPTNGASGQPGDVTVTIQFSEPMDQGTLQTAVDTSDLGGVSITWNEAGDTMTIKPDAPLDYAEGTGDDPSTTPALTYAVTVAATAADRAGNALGTAQTVQFSTLKAMSSVYPLIDSMSRTLTPSAFVFDDNDPLVVGDDASNNGMVSTVTFDLSAMPSSAVGVVAATFATRQQLGDLSGNPFGELSDNVVIDHVTFQPMDGEAAINAAFNSYQTTMGTYGNFCVQDQVVIQFDLTDAVADDVAMRVARSNRSQYLLRFMTLTNLDGGVDRAVISRDLAELSVTYLAP